MLILNGTVTLEIWRFMHQSFSINFHTLGKIEASPKSLKINHIIQGEQVLYQREASSIVLCYINCFQTYGYKGTTKRVQ